MLRRQLFDNYLIICFVVCLCLVGLSYATVTMHSLLETFEEEFELTQWSFGGLIQTLFVLGSDSINGLR